MRTHLRTAHGIRVRGVAKNSTTKPRQKRGRQKRERTIVPLPVQHIGELEVVTPDAVIDHATNGATFTPMPFVVLEHSDGSLWIAEKVSERAR